MTVIVLICLAFFYFPSLQWKNFLVSGLYQTPCIPNETCDGSRHFHDTSHRANSPGRKMQATFIVVFATMPSHPIVRIACSLFVPIQM